MELKFIYSEKASKFCEILLLITVHTVKSKGKISQNFVAFSEYMNFTTFTQLTARLKNFLMGWLLVLGLKEGLVECATVCVKSEVTLLCCVVLKKN